MFETRTVLIWGIAATLCGVTAACSGVKAWERGTLAHPTMTPGHGREGTAADFVGHCYDVREAATGRVGQAGGGCGCN